MLVVSRGSDSGTPAPSLAALPNAKLPIMEMADSGTVDGFLFAV